MGDDDTIMRVALGRAAMHADRPFMQSWFDPSGRKTDVVHTVRWGDLEDLLILIGKGLAELGLDAGDRVGVFSPNSPRWVLSTFGILASRCTFVPIYPTSSAEDLWWCMHDSGARVLILHGRKQLERALSIRDRLPELERIVVMDPDVDTSEPGVMGFDSLLDLGRHSGLTDGECQALVAEAEPSDLASVIYTSGTTGRPKGVMLTNANFVAQMTVADTFGLGPGDVWLAHLPMCHSLGFSCDLLNAGYHGGSLFVADSVETDQMRRNLATCRPTVMTSVPRLWEKLYLQITATVASRPSAVQKIFAWSVGVGTKRFLAQQAGEPLDASTRFKARWADRIFGKVRKKAGLDRLKACFTGGGPIQPDLLVFFGAIGVNIYQGFGLTETAPITHACVPGANRIGTIGRPIPGTECRLDEDGELLIKGPQVMKGYLNNEQATAEAFTDDGFFRTGDIAEIDDDGFVRIVDRKKEILITSGGKNIAPQKIQSAFNTDPYIEQVYVVADDRRFIAALVIPSFDALEPWARSRGLSFDSPEALSGLDEVRALMQERIDVVNATLSGFETIKRFAIIATPFTEEGGELTPTQKIRRRVVDEKYADVVESLYSD